MRQKALCFLSLLAAVLLTGCDPKPTDPVVPGTSCSKPNWVALINSEYSSSMTITCVPPVGETLSADDELAAFWEDTCRATAYLQDNVFYLGICGPTYEQAMELRYYSATYQTMRVVSTTYSPNDNVGSVDSPYILSFTNNK